MMQLRNISHLCRHAVKIRFMVMVKLWIIIKVNVLENYATLLGDLNKYKYAIPVDTLHARVESNKSGLTLTG